MKMFDTHKKFELSTRFCLFNKVALISSTSDCVIFGMKNIENDELKQKLKKAAISHFEKNNIQNAKILFQKISEEEIKKSTSLRYGNSEVQKSSNEKSNNNDIENQSVENKINAENDESVTVMLLDSILNTAIEKGATDIHIEEKCVRFRIVGHLNDYCSLTSEKSIELVRRIKALAKLDLLETRKGQDGQFSFKSDFKNCEKNHFVFVRVSCIPVVSSKFSNFESVVLRLLDTNRIPQNLKILGFDEKQQSELEQLCECENGLILICGATGSGKSTTAAALLRLIQQKSKSGKKIITIENPPEYFLDGMTQIRIDEKTIDFDDALRFVFRQDPDVIFIGEIRDEKTANACLRASLTGHLVIATLHSSGFFETKMRLKNLNVSENDISSSIRGVIVQKLLFVEKKVKLEAQIKLSESFLEKK